MSVHVRLRSSDGHRVRTRLELVPSTPFTPTVLNGLAAWWSADDLSDGAVSSWTDGIGSLELTQATGANQPVRAADSFNGSPGVTFDGTNDELTGVTTGLPTGSTAGEVWAVVKQDALVADATARCIVRYGGTSAATMRSIDRNAVSGANRFRVSDGQNPNNVNDANNDFSGIAIAGGAWSGTTQSGRFNGRATDPASTTIATLNTGTTRIRIGASTATTANLFWHGVIADVFVFTGLLTTRQRQQLEGWAAHHYGITSVLPDDHPFKSRAP